MRWLRFILLWVCYVLAGSGLDAQFYYPDNKQYGSPADYNLAYKVISFASADGTELQAWWVRTRSAKRLGSIIHFHGNAQNMSSHLRGVAWLADYGFDLFLFDYRGFGASEGRPNQKGVFEDCVAAIEMAQQQSPEEENFIVYGQSLGAANAVAVMGELRFPKMKGVVAEAPFYSYRTIAKDKVNAFLDLFVGVVVKDTKSPHLAVEGIAPLPLLLVHGTRDGVIPLWHSQALYKKAKQPKILWEVPMAGHLGIFTRQNQAERKRLLQLLWQWVGASP